MVGTRRIGNGGGWERELWLEMGEERQRPGGLQGQQASTDLVFAGTFYKRDPIGDHRP